MTKRLEDIYRKSYFDAMSHLAVKVGECARLKKELEAAHVAWNILAEKLTKAQEEIKKYKIDISCVEDAAKNWEEWCKESEEKYDKLRQRVEDLLEEE